MPPERSKRSPRLQTAKTLLAMPGVAQGGTARLVNLSTTGACVELEDSVDPGQTVELKLAHPKLGIVTTLSGEVVWNAEQSTKAVRAGLRFLDGSEADAAVRPFLTAEAGSCVFEDDELVGFVVPHGKARATWSVFDRGGVRLAIAARRERGYEVQPKVEGESSPPFAVASLHEATCRALGVSDPLRLEPAVATWRDGGAAKADPAEASEPERAEPIASSSRPVAPAPEPAELEPEPAALEPTPPVPTPAAPARTPAARAPEPRAPSVPPTRKFTRPTAAPSERASLPARPTAASSPAHAPKPLARATRAALAVASFGALSYAVYAAWLLIQTYTN